MEPLDYEDALFQKVQYDFLPFRQVRVVRNDFVVGRYSVVRRQLDIAVYRQGDPRPFFVADAKRHHRRLDVKTIESFIGMLDDVGAEIGLLASPSGSSLSATRRAQASDIHIYTLSITEALELNWRVVAQRIYPGDWAFHPELAAGLFHLYEGHSPQLVIDSLEQIPFDEWERFVVYSLKSHFQEAVEFLWFVVRHYPDEGWRYNALHQLLDADAVSSEQVHRLLQTECGADIRELLMKESPIESTEESGN